MNAAIFLNIALANGLLDRLTTSFDADVPSRVACLQ